MFWIPALLVGFGLFLLELFTSRHWLRVVGFTALSFALMGMTIGIDYAIRTTDVEVWSGQVEDWKHKEEWNEWHPAKTECHKDSNGHQKCHTKPGYWEHHYAENHLKTSDNGWFSINRTPDGRSMNDHFPNKTSELEAMFPKGTPSASTHTYTNKVQASYSIYRHKEIDLKDFPSLPKYPETVTGDIHINRLLGHVPNKQTATDTLARWNRDLNKMVPNPKEPGKMKSYKEVNLIMVNLGDVPKDYGFALQDSWEGGNKNDFVVAFSMDKNGDVKWAYPFSWSESELCKVEVRQYMEDLRGVKDFSKVVDDVGKLVEDKFVRKEFKDFNYLHIEPSTTAMVFVWILSILSAAAGVVLNRRF